MSKIIARLVSDEKMKEHLAKKMNTLSDLMGSISSTLKQLSSTNAEVLEETIELSPLAKRNETITHRYLKFQDIDEEKWFNKDVNYELTKDFYETFNKNIALRTNYCDDTRGNVIEVPMTGCAEYKELLGIPNLSIEGYNSIQEAYNAAIAANPEYAPTKRKEYSHKILGADLLSNRSIENGFINQDGSNGFTISFWTIFDNKLKVEHRKDFPLISFIGVNEKKYYNSEDAANDTDYCLANTTLQIFEDFRIEYKDVYKNEYKREYRLIDNKFFRRIMYRAWKQWMFVTIRFTDNDVDIFINGAKASPYNTEKGKRFMDGRGMTDGLYDQRPTITQFLSNPTTGCYLSTSIDGVNASRACWYDDIIFYNEALSDEEITEIYVSQVDPCTE